MKFFNDHLEEFFIIPLMFLMSIIIGIQVVMRYVFQNSLVWSEELSRYMFIWLIYFAVSYTARREKHIRIDAAINLYPKKLRPYIEILSELIVLGFSVFIAVTAITVFHKITWSGQLSPAMRIPMQYVYAAPLVGFVLTAIRQVQCILRRIKAIKNHEEVAEA
ncbi:TRAP transporter small permease [Anaerotignum propionicum]|jgi:TRAP-type C4-dicarboxylate transport system permease small subunit|uniref:Sialic acid TRAP transporter permease protein SiaT n=1 Tax=Anaerotignum propionicum DSM 1682 TaxID=991789 RepID=A0A0X8VBE4_ANAPI|nr:TRAP transporter small permease [Anaerotignum propionicum]AMJ39752.1 sialic acid TRAP transporter permease protein SiaT [Anaerotignum propionicum DSM 1682]MEA5056483.1 TRAP transporter small permease [Anaerotignum propionicum]SHE29056.1 TRAP-type C4-dicarboxylate transport system, small permease component [[Clostridium] propionicum DSM 1682] [Anaerotignum propionicum DSM 1682]HBF65947.1 TRAP transporter small permease [Clostridium sp.]